jgi:hypothetical protein
MPSFDPGLSSIVPGSVNRGPSLATCSVAIVAAIEADAKARREREEAHRRWSEEASRAVQRRPESIARKPVGAHAVTARRMNDRVV